MKLCSWNVNGIRAINKKGALLAFIDQFSPDIICLQETKAERNQVDMDLPEYEEFWNSASRKGYSGTAIFSKIKPISVRSGLSKNIVDKYHLSDNYGDLAGEGRVIAIELDNFWVVTVYVPNSKGDLSRLSLRKVWDEAFLEYLQELRQSKPVIFCGDMNVAHQEIDVANAKQKVGQHGFTQQERSSFDDYEKSGFIDVFRRNYPNRTDAYTWWSYFSNARARNIGWRLDYFLVDERIADRVKSAEIHPEIMGSDHCPVSIEVI